MFDLEALKRAAEAMRQDRTRRQEAWEAAETHMRTAAEYARQGDNYAKPLGGQQPGETEMVKSRLFRALGLAHLRIAREFAKDSGLDVSGVTIPEE